MWFEFKGMHRLSWICLLVITLFTPRKGHPQASLHAGPRWSRNNGLHRQHRLQHGSCVYTFLLPELDGCSPHVAPTPKPEEEFFERQSNNPNAFPNGHGPIWEWAQQQLDQLEEVVENNTQWLHKLEGSILRSNLWEHKRPTIQNHINHSDVMLRLGVALFRHATEHAGKLADVEAQFLNQTVSLEKDLREQTESRKKLEKQLQHQINYMDHLKERHGVLRRSLHDLEWQQHRWVSAARWDERGLRRVLVQRGRVMDGLQGHLAMSTANGSALRRRQVQLQRAVHGLLAASHAGLHGAHAEESVPFQDCAGAYNAGNTKSGVYTIQASGISKPIKVYCDMEIQGGGWTLIQHRGDGSVDFHRKWVEYKQGFGDPSGDHWLGNQHVFELTHQQAYVLRIELQDWDNGTAYVQYNTFYVASEKLQYRIYVKGFSGTAGKYSSLSQSGVSFSTKDADNDNCVCRCAHMATGGWWFDACGPSNLNGMYYTGGQHVGKFNGIKWHYWKGSSYSLRLTTMKIRPLSFSRGRRGGRAENGTDAHPAGM